MFLSKQASKWLSVIILLLMSLGQGIASEIRVSTLGFPGLVPDEEVDISLNPAYLGLIEGRRVFCGVDYRRSYTNISSGYSIKPYSESLYPFSPILKLSLKYYPILAEQKRYYEKNYYRKNYSNTNKAESFDFKSSWKINSSLIGGIALSNSYNREDYFFKENGGSVAYYDYQIQEESTDKIEAYSAKAGLTFLSEGNRKVSIILLYDFSQLKHRDTYDTERNGYDADSGIIVSGEDKTYEMGLRLMPEINLNAKSVVRSNLLIKYKRKQANYSKLFQENEESFPEDEASLTGEIGVGFSHVFDEDTYWFINLLDNIDLYNKHWGDYNNDSFPTYGDVEYRSDTNMKGHDIDLLIGLEKYIIKKVLILRSKINILNLYYQKIINKDYYYEQESTFKINIIRGPVHSYSFGVGYNFNKNILFDLDLYQIFESSKAGSTNEKDYRIKFAATYSF